MRCSFVTLLALICGCAGTAPAAIELAPPPADDQRPDDIANATPPNADTSDKPQIATGLRPGDPPGEPTGRKVWEVIPNAPHGQCCTSNDECGKITCEPYEYAHASCERVCTYSCDPGDICPAIGGTLDPPSACPESGLCPVGSPFV